MNLDMHDLVEAMLKLTRCIPCKKHGREHMSICKDCMETITCDRCIEHCYCMADE